MTIDKLKDIVSRLNKKYLSTLSNEAEQDYEKFASVRGTISRSLPCFCGRTKNYGSADDFLNSCLVIPDPQDPSKEISVAVGTVIDNQEAHENHNAVVLAVGINYGQGASYAKQTPLVQNTSMRKRLDLAFKQVTKHSALCPPWNEPSQFHLVTANFFPWITSASWSDYDFNSIEEMLLLRCHGYSNPFDPILDLVDNLKGELAAIVFHGANNAVPYLGSCMLSQAKTKDFDVILCDNLAPSKHRLWNAVLLCDYSYRPRRDSLAQFNFDE